MSSALSTWDRERLANAMTAFRDAQNESDDVAKALLSAIRAADAVKPPPEMAKPLPDAEAWRFLRKLENALRDLADPGTEIDTANNSSILRRWQDYWLMVNGVVWFVSVRPNQRHTVMPLAETPERYDSRGLPVSGTNE